MRVNLNIIFKRSGLGAVCLNNVTGDYLRLNYTGYIIFEELQRRFGDSMFHPGDVEAILVDKWDLDKNDCTAATLKIIKQFREEQLIYD